MAWICLNLWKNQFEDIQKALCAYGAIGFRNQKLSHQNQIDFAPAFWNLEVHPIVKVWKSILRL